MMRSNRLFDEEGNELYSGFGTISREALDATVDGRAYIETLTGFERLSRPEGDTEDEIRRLVDTATRLGGYVPEVNVSVDTTEGEEVSATIHFPPREAVPQKVDLSSVLEIMLSVHKNALRGQNCHGWIGTTVGTFERNVREGIALAEKLYGGRLPVNIIPSSVKGACEETAYIFAGCIPQGSIHRPSVAVISEQHPMEVEERYHQHEHTIWKEPLNQFIREFIVENLDAAANSGCLQGTWKDIHVFMPIPKPIDGISSRENESLEDFCGYCEDVSARTGREIKVTIHWQDSTEELVY
jgi:hypothetical protein